MDLVEASMFKKMERNVKLNIDEMHKDLFIQNYRIHKHTSNKNIHTTPAEKIFWNNKVNIEDEYGVIDETLVFNRL